MSYHRILNVDMTHRLKTIVMSRQNESKRLFTLTEYVEASFNALQGRTKADETISKNTIVHMWLKLFPRLATGLS